MRKIYLFYVPLCMMLIMASCGEKLEDADMYEAIKSDISVNETSFSISGESQELNIRITSSGYWMVTDYPRWLYLDYGYGQGSGSLVFWVNNNPSTTEERTGSITITDGIKPVTITVTQAPIPEEIVLSENSLQFAYNGGSSTITVSSNIDWDAISDQDWCKLSISTSRIAVSTQANNSYSSRTATITVTGLKSGPLTIRVSQSAAKEPTLGNVEVSNITKNSANCKFSYSSNDLYVYERGICYSSSSSSPTTSDAAKKASGNNKSGTSSFSLTGLQPNTTYYVRPYVTTDAGTTYGKATQFTTKDVSSPNEGDNPTPGY